MWWTENESQKKEKIWNDGTMPGTIYGFKLNKNNKRQNQSAHNTEYTHTHSIATEKNRMIYVRDESKKKPKKN